MEITTLGSIYIFKLMIDHLGEAKSGELGSDSKGYAFSLWVFFAVLRMISMLTRIDLFCHFLPFVAESVILTHP